MTPIVKLIALIVAMMAIVAVGAEARPHANHPALKEGQSLHSLTAPLWLRSTPRHWAPDTLAVATLLPLAHSD